MYRARLVTISLILLLVLSPGAAVATAGSPPDMADVIIEFEDASARDPAVVTGVGGTVTGGQSVTVIPVLFARVPEASIPMLRRQPGVTSVERDERTAAVGESTPWGIVRIGGRTAAASVDDQAEAAVTVAVLDTGVDTDHVDLEANLAWGANTVGPQPIERGLAAADDDNGHGTHVAGTVAAAANGIGVVGVAPRAQLYAMKILDDGGFGTTSDLVQGIDEALKGPDGTVGTSDDADVIAMSLGSTNGSDVLQAAVERAAERAVLVASAGNEGDGDLSTDDVLYPARYPEVVAVAATDQENRVPDWSSDGPAVEIAAPGVSVNSTIIGGYGHLSGTSMAAPHVAGTVALVLANDLSDGSRDLSNADIRILLQSTALDIGPAGADNASGHGLIQAHEAVGNSVVDLELSVNRSPIRVDDPVRFTVRRADSGDPVGATLTIGGEEFEVGTDGNLTHRFDRQGTVTVTASKNDSQSAVFRSTSLDLSVERKPVGLSLEAGPRSTVVNESVTFTVRRVDTDEPVTAIVTVDGESLRTDANGTVSYTFDEPRTFTATAEKAETDRERFLPASVEVSVDRATVGLSLEAEPRTPAVNETVRFTVRRSDTETGTAATITVARVTLEANGTGQVDHAFQSAGTFVATANKPATNRTAFVNASVEVIVHDPERSLPEIYDTNANGRLDLREIQRAIQDWAAGSITLQAIRDLIQLWASGESV